MEAQDRIDKAKALHVLYIVLLVFAGIFGFVCALLVLFVPLLIVLPICLAGGCDNECVQLVFCWRQDSWDDWGSCCSKACGDDSDLDSERKERCKQRLFCWRDSDWDEWGSCAFAQVIFCWRVSNSDGWGTCFQCCKSCNESNSYSDSEKASVVPFSRGDEVVIAREPTQREWRGCPNRSFDGRRSNFSLGKRLFVWTVSDNNKFFTTEDLQSLWMPVVCVTKHVKTPCEKCDPPFRAGMLCYRLSDFSPPAHDYDENDVLKLLFDDGTTAPPFSVSGGSDSEKIELSLVAQVPPRTLSRVEDGKYYTFAGSSHSRFILLPELLYSGCPTAGERVKLVMAGKAKDPLGDVWSGCPSDDHLTWTHSDRAYTHTVHSVSPCGKFFTSTLRETCWAPTVCIDPTSLKTVDCEKGWFQATGMTKEQRRALGDERIEAIPLTHSDDGRATSFYKITPRLEFSHAGAKLAKCQDTPAATLGLSCADGAATRVVAECRRGDELTRKEVSAARFLTPRSHTICMFAHTRAPSQYTFVYDDGTEFPVFKEHPGDTTCHLALADVHVGTLDTVRPPAEIHNMRIGSVYKFPHGDPDGIYDARGFTEGDVLVAMRRAVGSDWFRCPGAHFSPHVSAKVTVVAVSDDGKFVKTDAWADPWSPSVCFHRERCVTPATEFVLTELVPGLCKTAVFTAAMSNGQMRTHVKGIASAVLVADQSSPASRMGLSVGQTVVHRHSDGRITEHIFEADNRTDAPLFRSTIKKKKNSAAPDARALECIKLSEIEIHASAVVEAAIEAPAVITVSPHAVVVGDEEGNVIDGTVFTSAVTAIVGDFSGTDINDDTDGVFHATHVVGDVFVANTATVATVSSSSSSFGGPPPSLPPPPGGPPPSGPPPPGPMDATAAATRIQRNFKRSHSARIKTSPAAEILPILIPLKLAKFAGKLLKKNATTPQLILDVSGCAGGFEWEWWNENLAGGHAHKLGPDPPPWITEDEARAVVAACVKVCAPAPEWECRSCTCTNEGAAEVCSVCGQRK